MAETNATLQQLDDAEIMRRIIASEESGMCALLLAHGPKVRGFLTKRHGPHIAAEALNDAALLIFLDASTKYTPGKGSLAGWFLRIAHRKALDIRKGEDRKKFVQMDFDPGYNPSEGDDEDYPLEKTEDMQKRERRDHAIADIVARLPRVRRIVIQCDLLDATGHAPLDVIRKALDNPTASVNSVDVARSKARAFIRDEMRRLGYYP
jgi:DNA-directed RNA polymerase specialized sigma24 family protein